MKTLLTIFLVSLANISFSQNTKHDIDSIESLIKNIKNPNKIYAEKGVIILKYFLSGNEQKAQNLYFETLNQALKTKADSGIAFLYHVKGNLFYYESRYDSALAYFEKALELRKKIGDNVGILRTTGNIGGIYFMYSDYKKALTYFESVLKKEEELGYDEGTYISIGNLGAVYKALKFYDKAYLYYKKAEKIYLKSDNLNSLSYVYDGLSDIYGKKNQEDSAIYYSLKALQLSKQLNDIHSICFGYINLATFYIEIKKYNWAQKNLDTALSIAVKSNDRRLKLLCYANFVGLELKQNRSDSAMKYVAELARIEEKTKSENKNDGLSNAELGAVSEVLAKYYHDKKNYEKACYYLECAKAYSDSIYSLEMATQVSEMQAKYETEKKEKQNQILRHENEKHKTTRDYLLVILAVAGMGIIGGVIAYRKIKRSNEVIVEQKEILEEKQKEILDSINYARRIQYALLASDSLLNKYLQKYFVLFKPKDVVSGDFYWATPTDKGFIYVTADCTGHGVPGAFMSLLNISKLNQAINEHNITQPDLILNNVRSEIVTALNPEGSLEVSKDGMDAVVCKLDLKNMKLQFSAANNSFYIIRNDALTTCKADKIPVGKGHDDSLLFSFNEIELQKGDIIYTFTDGFADQFGGSFGKKFKYQPFEELLLSIHKEPMDKQKMKLEEAFNKWKGVLEQVDDVCVIGVLI